MMREVETSDPPSEEEEDAGRDDSAMEEDVLLSVRAKLLIHGETMLDKGTGKKSWFERGVGEIRLMQNREKGTIRVLMRHENSMKIILNHALDPDLALTPNVSSNRSWVWVAPDFANGESLVDTTFACRFNDSSVAEEFKTAFEKYQAEMKKLATLTSKD